MSSERDPAYGMAQLEFVQTWLRGVYEESLTVPDRTTLERSTRQMAAVGPLAGPARRRERDCWRRAPGPPRASPRCGTSSTCW